MIPIRRPIAIGRRHFLDSRSPIDAPHSSPMDLVCVTGSMVVAVVQVVGMTAIATAVVQSFACLDPVTSNSFEDLSVVGSWMVVRSVAAADGLAFGSRSAKRVTIVSLTNQLAMCWRWASLMVELNW